MTEETIKQQITLKKKKKKWIQIYGSNNFKDIFIGEGFVSDPNQLIGKQLEVNLMELMNDIKKQNFKIKFLVNNISENRAIADMISYELIGNMVKRVVKRGKSKIDDSFIAETKDNVKILVKPIILTKSKVAHSILTKIKSKTRELLIGNFKKHTYDEIIKQILNQEIHKHSREHLKKIFPLSVFEIRYLRRL